MILKGRCVAPGVARGSSYVWAPAPRLAAALTTRPMGPPSAEIERLHAAVGRACVQLDRTRRQVSWHVSEDCASIFDTHARLLRDAALIRQIQDSVLSGERSAEAAVADVVTDVCARFTESATGAVRDKADDILDIGWRLIQCLSLAPSEGSQSLAGTIVVAESVTPSELVRFVGHGVAGVVTEFCGPKSHTAILARELRLPLVTGIAACVDTVPHETAVLLDADNGVVFVGPIPLTDPAGQAVLTRAAQSSEPAEDPTGPLVTKDGVPVTLMLNISVPAEAPAVASLGAAGVGLFRTEFIYMDRPTWPSEQESYEAYAEVARGIGDRELNIRLADFGAEKLPPYADIPVNRNPSLGLRGLRLLLQRWDILEPQVRAVARLARERPVTLLLPMLDTPDTLQAATDGLVEILGCQTADQFPFRFGTMIELPSAALQVEEILPRVHSVAIGLNDLTQYLLAADRDDEHVEPYHDAYQPVLLRMVRSVVQSADRAGKLVSVCGELAGEPRMTSLLLALGLRRLSVSQSSFRQVAAAIRRTCLGDVEQRVDDVLRLGSGQAVRRFVAGQVGLGADSTPA